MTEGPLAGLRVIEFEAIGPAPFCGMHFADLGADVIVIERKTPPADYGDGVLAGIVRRGKRSIALDLKDASDKALALDLVARADAVIEGMRPGVMERLGLGPDDCMLRNPRLAYGRLTGWGQDGPLAQAAGHDINYAGLSGAAWYAGHGDRPPLAPPTLVGDVAGGAHYLMIGLLSAILRARTTGEGDVVDAAVVDGSAHMTNLLLDLMPSGAMRAGRGESMLDGPPWYRAYACADGKYVSVGALEEKFYQTFLDLVGLKDDPVFASRFDPAVWPKQADALATLFASKPAEAWTALLEGTDACVAAVLSPVDAPAHPHNVARGVFDDSAGYWQAVPAPRFKNGRPAEPDARKSPTRGEHTDEIRKELATYPAEPRGRTPQS
ncbi:MAG: CaiB/BaiF CoA-transferase family protein [Pseudomonadota bacterium]